MNNLVSLAKSSGYCYRHGTVDGWGGMKERDDGMHGLRPPRSWNLGLGSDMMETGKGVI
jgi:hypothetical protein